MAVTELIVKDLSLDLQVLVKKSYTIFCTSTRQCLQLLTQSAGCGHQVGSYTQQSMPKI